MERWQPERLPARFQPRGPGQLASLRTWLPLTAVVAVISFGMLVYSLLPNVPTPGSLYKVISTASHQSTPAPTRAVRPLPAPPQLLPTRTR